MKIDRCPCETGTVPSWIWVALPFVGLAAIYAETLASWILGG